MIKDHSNSERNQLLPLQGGTFSSLQQGIFYMHRLTDKVVHNTAFVTPIVIVWKENQLSGSTMRDWSDDLSHHEQTLYLEVTSCLWVPLHVYKVNEIVSFIIYTYILCLKYKWNLSGRWWINCMIEVNARTDLTILFLPCTACVCVFVCVIFFLHLCIPKLFLKHGFVIAGIST